MTIDTKEYALGTSVTSSYPWGTYVKARVMCSDGVVRPTKRISQTADTFFSVPCAVTVKGKTVAGYMTFSSVSGSDVATDWDPGVAKFIATTYNKNHALLPEGAWKAEPGNVPDLVKARAIKFLTRCADDQGKHWSGGVTWAPEECPTCHGTNDAGWLHVPGGRYGSTSAACAEVTWDAHLAYLEASGGELYDEDALTSLMSSVVNSHDDIAYLIGEYHPDPKVRRFARVEWGYTREDA